MMFVCVHLLLAGLLTVSNHRTGESGIHIYKFVISLVLLDSVSIGYIDSYIPPAHSRICTLGSGILCCQHRM